MGAMVLGSDGKVELVTGDFRVLLQVQELCFKKAVSKDVVVHVHALDLRPCLHQGLALIFDGIFLSRSPCVSLHESFSAFQA